MKGRSRGPIGARVRTIAASEFKARCLELLDRVRAGEELVVTKRGEPVARIVPIETVRVGVSLRGSWSNRLVISGDIVQVDWADEWESAR